MPVRNAFYLYLHQVRNMLLSHEQCQSFNDEGYLILRDVLSSEETGNLQKWTQEVHDWPTAEDSPWMPYEVFTKITADHVKLRTL